MENKMLHCSSYEHDVLSHMLELYQRSQLCDLALQTADRVFSVHKVILTAGSRYFKSLFDSGNLQGPSCVLPKLESTSALILIEFMYTGYLSLNADNVWLVLSAASTLDIPQAVELCQQFLKSLEENADDNDPKLELYNPDPTVVLDNVKLEHDDSLHTEEERTRNKSFENNIGLCSDEIDFGEIPESSEEEQGPSIGLKLKINLKQSKSKSRRNKPSQKKYLKKSSVNPNLQYDIISKKNISMSKVIKQEQHQKIRNFQSELSIKTINIENISDSQKKLNIAGDIDFKSDSLGLKRGRGRPRKSDKTPVKIPAKINISNSFMKSDKTCKISSKANWKRRQVINLRSEVGSHMCKICGAKFCFRSCLILHLCVLHKSVMRYKKSNKLFNKHLFAGAKILLTSRPDFQNTFSCTWQKCHKNFSRIYKLLDHVNTKHFRYYCHECKLTVSKPAKHYVIKHLDKWDKKRKLYRCGTCRRVFMYKNNLKAHIVCTHIHNKTKMKTKIRARSTWKCEEKNCDFSGTDKRSLLSHMTSFHEDLKFECRDCSFSTPLKKQLEKHLLQHTASIGKTCEICSKSFSKPSQLKTHMFTVHQIKQPGVNVLQCNDCEYTCVNPNLLKKHQQTHNDDKRYTCGECGKQLKTPVTLEKHINKVHKGIKPFMCEICGVAYGEESELKIHINRHGDVKTFYCDKCDYATYDKGNYKSHLFNRHGVKLTENMKTFSCNICDYVTDVKYRYNDHMRVHLNMRDIACPECDKCFMTRKALRGHIIKVHKPKNLHCDFCGYATADISKLKEHVRIMHTHRNFKPYKCAYCTFKCATSGNCRKHVMQKHRGMEVKVIKLVDKMPDLDVTTGKQMQAQNSAQKSLEDTFDCGLPEGALIQGILQYADKHVDKLPGLGILQYTNNEEDTTISEQQYYKLQGEGQFNADRVEQGIDMTYNPSQFTTRDNQAVHENNQQLNQFSSRNQGERFSTFQGSDPLKPAEDLTKKANFQSEPLLKKPYDNNRQYQNTLEQYQAILLASHVPSQQNVTYSQT